MPKLLFKVEQKTLTVGGDLLFKLKKNKKSD